jgi:peptide/nickel transport system substrate-binding protein
VSRRMTDHSRTRWLRCATLVGALAIVVAACGGTSSGNAGNAAGTSAGTVSTTLRTAFNTDMQVPDPDVFYETEGNQVVMSTYEGLVRYKQDPPTNAIDPLLATSWEKSADGKTYTFHLRAKVKFVDGTAMDSAAAKASFERRPKVNQGPAYMLTQVASYATPDPLTFVVKLKKPVSAFMDYLASPYGPKLLSPTALTKYAKGGDFAQGYLKTHSIGTGAYFIKSFTLGQQYVLAANPNYWGPKPTITTIEINIVPDVTTQQLKLEGGDLDILHALPASTTNSFDNKSGFQVITIPALQKQVLKINPQKAPFNDLSLRQALRSAIDRKTLTTDVFGDLGTVSTQMLPAGMMPAGSGLDSYTYDPTLLKTAVDKLPSSSKSITISYAIGSVNDQRTAEAIQKVLSDAGFNAKVTPLTTSEFFALRDQPESKVPNLLVETANPDAAHPDTYLRIFYNTGGFLNYIKGGSAAADAAMDRGLYTNDPSVVASEYAKAADLVHDSATFVTIADVKGTFVATDKLKGWTSTGAAPLSLNFQTASMG